MSISALNITGRARLPVIIAAEAAECGLACMAMIARYHGHDVDLNGMRQRFSLSLSGATLRSIMGFADALDLAPRPLRVELCALTKVQGPAILHWNLDHFVVLAKANRRGITIHDPASGKRWLSMNEASKQFTGVVVEFAPTANFTAIATHGSLPLWSLWSRMKGNHTALTQVLILSLALQVVTFAAPFQLQLVVDQALFRSRCRSPDRAGACLRRARPDPAGCGAPRGWRCASTASSLLRVMGDLVRHLLRLPAAFFEERHLGDILSRLGSVGPIQDAITRGLVAAMIDGVMALIAAIVLFFYSTMLAAIVLGCVALELLIAIAYYGATRARMEQEIVAKAKESSVLMESVRAAVTIKLLGREVEREARWRNTYASVVNAGFRTGKLQIGQGFLQALCLACRRCSLPFSPLA